jgi:hypothetical protein
VNAVIDHENPADNNIFVTCDASDRQTGAVLSWGPTWEAARPVAFDSMQLNPAQKNYPIHEKELLAIIQALKKWRSDLLGSPIYVYTDHRTLENFDTQKDLSRQQAHWMEVMSQFDMSIKGEDNTVADALSRLPNDSPPSSNIELETCIKNWTAWAQASSVNATLTINVDSTFLDTIKSGYITDEFCKKVISYPESTPGIREVNGLWYIGSRLLIPSSGTCREELFHLAHDALSHFSTNKAYASLRDCYYWPNMRCDLCESYVPSCTDCQRNKSSTTKPMGPLHPLPIPECRGDSVAIDSIGPLPEDEKFNCILSMMDRSGSDVRIVPTRTNISAEDAAALFFEHWYCENGLPLEIISNRDKLFVSKFWKVLHKLSSIKLKMSTAYHPQTDSSSERTNKTINQCIHYHVQCNQKGWASKLPLIHFHIMNAPNASTGYSPFQLRMGRSPCIIPPIAEQDIGHEIEEIKAANIIKNIENISNEAYDTLLAAKIHQAHYANKSCRPDETFAIGDEVMLSTLHCHWEYTQGKLNRVTKFLPHYDGPYNIIDSFPDFSAYKLELPNSLNVFPTFHASQLKHYVTNDPTLFPSCEHAHPGPILTPDGLEE